MAKTQLRTYVFVPGSAGAGLIHLPGKIDLQQILLITNTTSNQIIYNFADPSSAGTFVTFNRANTVLLPTETQHSDGHTVVQLAVDTSSMSTTDTLQIFIERDYQLMKMDGVGTDAFERIRTANPLSMLDADFEYGLQPTKWQVYDLMRGYPSIYEIPGTDQSVVSVTTDASGGNATTESLITVTVANPLSGAWVSGAPFTIKGYLSTINGFSRAEGSFIINQVLSSTSFTYYAKAQVGTTNGQVLSTTYTQLRLGGFYTGAQIGAPAFSYTNNAVNGNTATITLTFNPSHGFVPGQTILVTINSVGANNSLAQGPFFVETVPGTTQITYTARAPGVISGTLTGNIYVRPDCFYSHRPFDGGVTLGTGGPAYGALAVRMSKKYIRYQSGKSINYNTGALFAPSYDLRTITATGTIVSGTVANCSGSTTTITVGSTTGLVAGQFVTVSSGTGSFDGNSVYIVSVGAGNIVVSSAPTVALSNATITYTTAITVTTDNNDHGMQVGATVNIVGVTTTGYTGAFTVGRIIDERSLSFPATSTNGPPQATVGLIQGPSYMSLTGWYGATVRCGTFDDQNGQFWAFDGQNMYVALRYSTFQLAGTATVTTDNNAVYGLNTRWTTQLVAGDKIVIKGMTHVVTSVPTDTCLFVTPDYRGAGSVFGCIANSGTSGQSTIVVNTAIGLTVGQFVSGANIGVNTVTTKVGATAAQGTVLLTVPDVTNINVGQAVTGVNISSNTFVAAVNSTSNIVTLTTPTSGTVNTTVAFSIPATITQISGTTVTLSQPNSGTVSTAPLIVTTQTSGVIVTRTLENLIPSYQWNVDRCDGTNGPFNPSGYKIDVTKMQMVGIQWTWYGAGFIDFMLRGPSGNYMTVHRIKNSNVNVVAYMRSGNQPVRYEVNNEEITRTYLTSAITATDTTIPVTSTTFLPATGGYVWIDGEVVKYTSKNATSILGCTRAAPFTVFSAGQNRTFTGGPAAVHTQYTGLVAVGQTATPIIQHWGSAFIQDGGFDQDRGYIFNYQAPNISVSTKKVSAFAIRLAPSVSGSIIGDLGARELINRAQLLLQTIEITAGGTANTNSALVIEGVLNPQNFPSNPANITFNSLQGISNTYFAGGQPSFTQVASTYTFDGASTTTFIKTQTQVVANTSSSANTITIGAAPTLTVASVAAGVFTCSSATLALGMTVTLAGANGGTSGTLTAGTYYIVATNGSTQFTLGTAINSYQSNVFVANTGTVSTTTFTVGQNSTANLAVGMFVTVLAGTGSFATGTYASITAILTATTFTISQTPAVAFSAATLGFGAIAGAQTIFLTVDPTAAGIIAGDDVQVSATAALQGNTKVLTTNAVGVAPYFITLNNPMVAGIPPQTNVIISRNTYANPGETIFSFISSPSNKDSLDLKDLKELSNTPIGGRSTFPNGPDTLFINVYITQGTPVLANLVLRWGEAQA